MPLTPAELSAVQRLRRVWRDEIDQADLYETMDIDMGDDVDVALRLLDRILPAGERPVPICSYDANQGQILWNYDEDGGTFYGVVIEHHGKGTGGIHWDNCVGYGDEGYPTEAAAREALHHQLLEQIAAVAAGKGE